MKKSTIYIGSDHAGFDLKTSIKEHLETKGYVVEDLGAYEYNKTDDYPQFAEAVAETVLLHAGSVGILSCGNAEGVCIAANKFDGIRAGLGYSLEAAKTMRADDNTNILCLPGRLEIADDPLAILDAFLEAEFSKAPRHVRRLQQVSEIEANRTKIVNIVPAVLAKSKKDFLSKLTDGEIRALAPLWQIDILDGSLFENTCFADPSVLNVNDLPEIELHLMVNDPLTVITNWKNKIPSLRRAIVHAETSQPLETLLKAIRSLDLEVGVALNPKTPPEKIKDVIDLCDTILIMGVEPGASGQDFIGETVLEKINQARRLFPHVTIAVDGGIKLENARSILLAGADELCISSAIWKAEDKTETFQKIKNVLQS